MLIIPSSFNCQWEPSVKWLCNIMHFSHFLIEMKTTVKLTIDQNKMCFIDLFTRANVTLCIWATPLKKLSSERRNRKPNSHYVSKCLVVNSFLREQGKQETVRGSNGVQIDSTRLDNGCIPLKVIIILDFNNYYCIPYIILYTLPDALGVTFVHYNLEYPLNGYLCDCMALKA